MFIPSSVQSGLGVYVVVKGPRIVRVGAVPDAITSSRVARQIR